MHIDWHDDVVENNEQQKEAKDSKKEGIGPLPHHHAQSP